MSASEESNLPAPRPGVAAPGRAAPSATWRSSPRRSPRPQIRRDIARRVADESHERSIEQIAGDLRLPARPVHQLRTATPGCRRELQKLHRMAFNAALSMARLAEQACQFEHPDEAGHAEPDRRLLGRRQLRPAGRRPADARPAQPGDAATSRPTTGPLEIEQSFSLARFDPDALSKLKTDCACDFEIPEWYFDLTYPGHYRRRIKAVRLTIPLRRWTAHERGRHAAADRQPHQGRSRISSHPCRSRCGTRQRSRPASAQSDAGVFEFNFRDERYMPFEGAGVNSSWQLSAAQSGEAVRLLHHQ